MFVAAGVVAGVVFTLGSTTAVSWAGVVGVLVSGLELMMFGWSGVTLSVGAEVSGSSELGELLVLSMLLSSIARAVNGTK